MNVRSWLQKNEKVISAFFWIILVIWRIPFLNKGIDYTDTGFALVNYANLFGGSGINDISVFYTTLIGGIIYSILPFGQLLAFRILHWVIGLLTFYVTWKLMKRHINGNLILLAFLCMSFSLKSGEAFFGYFNLSGIVVIVMVALLYEGLVKDSNILIFCAGFVAGINVFVRLSNLLYLPAALCIIWYGICDQKSPKQVAREFLVAVSGACSAFLITLVIMILFMGWVQVLESLMDYVNLALGNATSSTYNFLGIEEVNGHSLIAEIKTIAYQFWKSMGAFGLVICPSVIVLLIVRAVAFKMNKERLGKIASLASMVIVSIVASFMLYSKFSVTSVPTWMTGLLSSLLCFVLLFRWKKERPEHNFLYLMNILLSFFSIWGSDGGLARFSIVKPFQIAMFIFCSMRIYENLSEAEAKMSKKAIVLFAQRGVAGMTSVALIFTVLMGVLTLPQVYCDDDVSELNYSVSADLSLFWGMKTSQTRADEINQYYEIMSDESIADKEVAIFGYWALGEVIGSQAGYFDEVLSCIDYARVDVESLLEVIEKKEEDGIVPVIVVSMVDALQRGMDSPNISEAKQAVLDYMLTLHEYEIYAQTDYFTVYIAAE